MTSDFSSVPHVRFVDASLGYGSKIIFESLNFSVPRGASVLILGLSGCGKTSILNAITGKSPVLSGQVRVDDAPVDVHDKPALFAMRRQMGMLFQQSGLFPDLTVGENIALPYYEHLPGLPDTAIRTAVLLKLQAVGLRGVIDLYPHALSGGMARRVALARAVALDPSLILYDEPLTGQDPISCGVLKQLILGLQDAYGATSIIVSHQIKTLGDMVDYVCVLGQKKVLMFDRREVVFSSQDPYVRQFLDGNPDGVIPFHYPCAPLTQQLNMEQAS